MLEKQRELRGGGGYCGVGYFPFKDTRCFLQRFQVRMLEKRREFGWGRGYYEVCYLLKRNMRGRGYN